MTGGIGGSDQVNILTIAGVLISGKVPTTAAGGGSNVSIINVSGNIPVTGGGTPLPVLASVSGDVKVTAAGAGLPVLASVSGDVKVTAAGAGLPVVATVSGDVRITAAGAPITVSSNAPGAVQGAIRGDAVYNALVSNPVKYGKVAAVAGAVCADIVAGVASRKIRVLGAAFFSTGTATAIFLTTGASAALTPKIPMANGFVLPTNPWGWFETAAGSALTLQVEAGTVGGVVTYQEVL